MVSEQKFKKVPLQRERECGFGVRQKQKVIRREKEPSDRGTHMGTPYTHTHTHTHILTDWHRIQHLLNDGWRDGWLDGWMGPSWRGR